MVCCKKNVEDREKGRKNEWMNNFKRKNSSYNSQNAYTLILFKCFLENSIGSLDLQKKDENFFWYSTMLLQSILYYSSSIIIKFV